MRVTFVGTCEGDCYDLYDVHTVILSEDGEVIKEHTITAPADLVAWRDYVVGWYIYELGSNFVTLTKDENEADNELVAVCMECGATYSVYRKGCKLCSTPYELLFVRV